ncbi:5-oxoprolinase subunit PxpA [Pseudomaricurvus sp. HS19]|uniref:5-oxoprolinase subunit PxpA n=1 Tax=Pseudomaricurvus sp. HS19 TaxID=2692626 RepID=UPI00351AA0B3
MTLLLNCDLGESYGSWTMGLDAAVMPHIDQANIACGFHAGDPLVMHDTLQLARQHGVRIGAHPAYPDLGGFGRRSMNCSPQEIRTFVTYQAAALAGMAQSLELQLEYIKPHGALYNDMMARADVRHAIMEAVAGFYLPVKLMLQATPEADLHRKEAEHYGIKLLFEAFADRCYDDDGKLLSRSKPGAVHSRDKMLAQVEQLLRHGTVTTASGLIIPLHADSLCVHGDNMEAVQSVADIRALITA